MDLEKAVQLYQKSAEAGNSYAQCDLATCYKNGKGVEIDLEKAIELYLKSAEADNSLAQHNLAYCYEKGKGVEIDFEKAFHWYQKSAEAGNSKAQKNLADCYEHGKGVEIDLEKAFQWYQKSSEALNSKTADGETFTCAECLSLLEGYYSCKICLIRHCEETFRGCDNEKISEILKSSNLHISASDQILEFIPFTNFDVMNKIGEGGFSKVLKAKWINGGIIDSWNSEDKSWRRKSPPRFVALKICDRWEIFINEVRSILMLSKYLAFRTLMILFLLVKDSSKMPESYVKIFVEMLWSHPEPLY